MKKYVFEEFMESNNIQKEQLPELLQKRITGFEEMKSDLEYTIEDDRDRLERRLEDLADELEEDIYEEYEDSLENNSDPNEEEEEKLKKELEEKERLKKEQLQLKERLLKKEKMEKEKREKEQQEKEKLAIEMREKEKQEKEKQEKEKVEIERQEREKQEKESKKIPELSPDEFIIEQLYRAGKRKIGKSWLLEKGFKTNLDGRQIIIGKYKLIKALFSFSYSIQALSAAAIAK